MKLFKIHYTMQDRRRATKFIYGNSYEEASKGFKNIILAQEVEIDDKTNKCSVIRTIYRKGN